MGRGCTVAGWRIMVDQSLAVGAALGHEKWLLAGHISDCGKDWLAM